jgi:hypothetical protein
VRAIARQHTADDVFFCLDWVRILVVFGHFHQL